MTTKENVLTLLMTQAPEFISGEEMAQKLEVSRTAIWKAIKELKKEGYLINSSTNKGYQYLPSDILSAEGIRLYLSEKTPDLSIKILDSSTSTMRDVKLAAVNGEPENTLVVADMQEAPKGRFGRPFFAKKGGGIYMSILLRPNQRFEEMAQYTLIMAVAIAEALDKAAGIVSEIKWVNDIYINGRKVCGILSEAMSDVESGQITNIVIGMGINFAIRQDEFPEDIRDKATSLYSDGQPTITKNELIALIWNRFYKILNEKDTAYLDIYRKKSFVLGKEVTFIQKQVEYQGIAKQINNLGELIVQLPNGDEKALSSGEISLKKIQG
ncbi:biotin--[acetyl-CoA-carboxylase] ligase [Enterococcus sp. LJL128]